MGVRGISENELGQHEGFRFAGDKEPIIVPRLITTILERREQMSLEEIVLAVNEEWEGDETPPTSEQIEALLHNDLEDNVVKNNNGTFTLLDVPALR